MGGLHFDERYRETVRLGDGTEVTLRLVRPDDKGLMRDGFDKLSPESRYGRFFGPKDHLTERELAYLTEMDGRDHLAIGALVHTDDGDEGLGVARFIRLPDRPDCAEAAITVTDEAQGKGLGRLLLQRLVAAAWERGVRTFHCEVLARNTAVESLLRSLAPGVAPKADGGVLEFDVPLPEVPADQLADEAPRTSAPYRLLMLAAEGLLWLRELAPWPVERVMRIAGSDPPEEPMPDQKTLVVPTDFSEPSDRGLDVAIEYAQLLGAQIALVNVNDSPAYFGFDAIAVPEVEKAMALRIARGLDDRAARVRARGVTVQVVRLEGSPWEAITDYARQAGAALIVMGTHGRTGIKHAFIGSVAERVIPRAPCPVLVIPPQH